MSIIKGYDLHAQISALTADANENDASFRVTKYAQTFLTIATTLIYYSFTSVIFAGVSVWAFQQYVFENGTNVNGLIYTVALVVSTPIGLALAKHGNFRAMAHAHSFREFVVRAILALAVITGVWYEAVSSSSNLQEKAFHSVESSNAGKSILNSGVTISSGNTALADAEFKLVSCQRKLKEGSVKDCLNSEARVNSLKEQAALDRQSANDASIKAVTVKQAALSKERDEHALPAAKSFAGMFDTSLATGTMFIVVLSSLFFELIHLTTIYNERQYLAKLQHTRESLQMLKGDYFKAVGKVYSPDDFKDDKTLDVDELRSNGVIRDFSDELPDTLDDKDTAFKITTRGKPYEDPKPGFGFVPQSAKLFKWQDQNEPLPAKAEKLPFGFIPKSKAQADSPEMRESSGFHQTPEQRANVQKLADGMAVHAPTRKPLHGRVGDSDPLHGRVDTRADDAYTQALEAKAGEYVDCPQCGGKFRKVNKQHTFCKSACKDEWHNTKDPKRLEALKAKSRKRKG
ncbi:MAG: hypothetical protein PHE17_09040 [Thiothrix sp.]|uniref:hypothetical protein n=1 Tax=Thiothrix sp. TaxID=1032 RepID=UPI00263044FB|nr:hypothetical protein [Thiothrix sp.]MDD5393149.1 hypothetical protein [Thiothrix sp.]